MTETESANTMTKPSELASKIAVAMEIHAACGTKTQAKAIAIDELLAASRKREEALQAEIERLREALREVLHIADGYGSSSGRLAGIVLTASAALEGEKTND